MITCQELDALVEQVCDLTRQMPATDRIREATGLLELAESLPRRMVMQWRAAAAADMHYLNDLTMREIAEQVGSGSFQAIAQWIATHGPSHYLALSRTGDAGIDTKIIAMDSEDTRVNRGKLRHYRSGGYRIVPACWNVLDGAELRPDTIPQKLWNDLDPAHP